MTARPPLLLVAAGGTGGHMFPAQALSEAMLRKGWRVKLSTDERGARYTGGFAHVVEVEIVKSATFAQGGLLARMGVPFKLLAGVLRAARKMLADRPDVVIGFGGYPTIPALGAAWLLRRPSMIHEQNGVLGRVNQVFAARVRAVACGVWPTELPKNVVGEFVGNPVRAAVAKREGAPYIPPGDYPMSLVVVGGSQGARILSQVVPEAISLLPAALRDRLRVAHQARAEDLDQVRDAYAKIGASAEVEPFFVDIPNRFADAQLVISRAGASSVADLTIIGRPSILVPFAAATADHQTANARGLVEAGAAILIPESLSEPQALADHIAAILEQPEAAVKMAHAALSLARPDATQRLADLVDRVAKGERVP